MKNKKVVITGGAGFIGSNLAHELATENNVTVIDDLSTGRLENISDLIEMKKIRFVHGSILNLQLLQKIFHGIDFVFHQAAIPSVPRSIDDPVLSNNVNISGTLNVLLAARDNTIDKVIFASSSSVYGDTPILPKKEEMTPNLQSIYALTKLAGEYYCQLFHQIYGLSTICLRYFNVYGLRQDPHSDYAAVIPKFIDRVRDKKPLIIYGDGNQTRDFTYIRDIVNANILAAESQANGVYNIGTGKSVTINKLVQLITEVLTNNVKPIYNDPRPGDIRDSLADISSATKAFGYHPQYSLKNGILEMINN